MGQSTLFLGASVGPQPGAGPEGDAEGNAEGNAEASAWASAGKIAETNAETNAETSTGQHLDVKPQADPIPGPAAVEHRVRIQLSSTCHVLVERMLAEYGRRGIKVSVSELVEQALRRLWAAGSLDEMVVPGPRPEAGPTDEVGQTPEAEAPLETKAALEAGPEPSKADPEATRVTPATGGARRVAIADHKILAVVVSVAETGETWMRTMSGLIPVRLADLQGLAPVVQIVTLADLHSRLSERASSKTMPVSGTLFVAAVSGGRCQRGGCNKPATHIHHQVPQAEGGNHGPGNSFGLCRDCHDELHGDLIANPQDHPADWVRVGPGERPDPSAVNREYQRIKREALASGFRVA